MYSLTEKRLRFRLFRKSVQEAAEINSEDLGWEAGMYGLFYHVLKFSDI